MTLNDDATRLTVRVPADIREWLARQVRRNASSHSSEIVRALRERMKHIEDKETE
jgi:Arc/MetJ-type ribon-helix-helix transcriptional regulator